MNKIISAKQILKEKGYVQKKFDTEGFMNAVAKFFIENDTKIHLHLFSLRFLDVPTEEEIDKRIKDFPDSGRDYYNPFQITDEDKELGWKAHTAFNEAGEIVWAREMLNQDYSLFKYMCGQGYIAPHIVIDKPFFENAAGLLRVMGGFIVEKETTKRRKSYDVTLV